MKVLFVHSNQSDYLAESLFHGLRTLLGINCVDVPRYDSMYAPLNDRLRSKLRGYGFTLYGLLEELPLAEERYFWQKDLAEYDLVIIANVWFQWETLWEMSSFMNPERLIILDGSDTPAFFPYASLGWRIRKRPWSYFTPVSKFKYCKRELIGEGCSYSLDRFLPRPFRQWISLPKNAIPISFSIPEEKIWNGDLREKIKDFPIHIVDPEIATYINGSFFSSTGSDQYIFSSEYEYYSDLRKSRFGITTKRAGWDCLRHYELAANGCILCFHKLDNKPSTCAPHGLDKSNSISYHTWADLKMQIQNMSHKDYLKLQQASKQWINANTTRRRASEFLSKLGFNI